MDRATAFMRQLPLPVVCTRAQAYLPRPEKSFFKCSLISFISRIAERIKWLAATWLKLNRSTRWAHHTAADYSFQQMCMTAVPRQASCHSSLQVLFWLAWCYASFSLDTIVTSEKKCWLMMHNFCYSKLISFFSKMTRNGRWILRRHYS